MIYFPLGLPFLKEEDKLSLELGGMGGGGGMDGLWLFRIMGEGGGEAGQTWLVKLSFARNPFQFYHIY